MPNRTIENNVVFKKIDKRFLSAGRGVWKPGIVYYNDFVNVRVLSQPIHSIRGHKYKLEVINLHPSRNLLHEFSERLYAKDGVVIWYNHNNGTVEITLLKNAFDHLKDFYTTLKSPHTGNTNNFSHPLAHYWSSGIIYIYS